jgi:UDP-N-acetyl-D-galactosamine dehydrogenase
MTKKRNHEKTKKQKNEITKKQKTLYDAVVLGVAHKEFLDMDLTPLKKEVSVVYDGKGVLKAEQVDAKL